MSQRRQSRPPPAAPGGEGESQVARDRRRAILRAAVSVFAAKGYHGCRIADVAREAGVAYGLVYHYFQNKEELLHSVFSEGWRRFADSLRKLAEADAPIRQQVEAIVDYALEAYRHDPRSMRVLILEVARSPAFRDTAKRSAFEEAIRLTADLIQRAGDRGELRPGVDPFLAACVLFGSVEILLTTLVLGYLDERRGDDIEKAKHAAVEIFCGGVERTGEAPRKLAAAKAPARTGTGGKRGA